MKNYRQGDVIIVGIEKLPVDKKSLKARKDNVILEGETSGHKHLLLEGELYEDEQGNLFVKANEDTQVVHEEHKPIDIEKGLYRVIRQREYAEDTNSFVVD